MLARRDFRAGFELALVVEGMFVLTLNRGMLLPPLVLRVSLDVSQGPSLLVKSVSLDLAEVMFLHKGAFVF